MHSVIIARLVGPVLLVSAAAILLNRNGIQKTVEGAARNPAFIYLAGLMTLLGGLAIVEFHNEWVAGWPVLITLLGWLMVLGGVARMLLPDQLAALGKRMIHQDELLVASAAVSAVIGVILTANAF